MKLYKKLRFSIIITVILAALCGCSKDDDDAPAPPMPLKDIIGLWDEDYVHVTVNGNKCVPPMGEYASGTVLDGDLTAGQTEGEIYLASLFTTYWDESPIEDGRGRTIGHGETYMAPVPIQCKALSDELIVFSGSYDAEKGGMRIEVEGTVKGAGIYKDLDINFTYSALFDELVDRTFEISFTDGSVYAELSPGLADKEPVVIDGEPVECIDLVNELMDNISKAYYEKMGYDRAKIRFNRDLSYDVWYRDAGTGQYIPSAGRHYYTYTHYSPEHHRIYFFDSREEVIAFRKYFDFWGEVRSELMHTQVIEYNGQLYDVLSMDYEVTGDKLTLTYYNEYYPLPFSLFTPSSVKERARHLQNLCYEFLPKAVFTEVK